MAVVLENYVASNDEKRQLLNKMNSVAGRVRLGNAVCGPIALATKLTAVSVTVPSVKTISPTAKPVGLYIATAASVAFTLPKASDVPAGYGFRFYFQSTSGTIVPNGSDTIAGSNSTTNATQWVRYVLISDGVSDWSSGTS